MAYGVSTGAAAILLFAALAAPAAAGAAADRGGPAPGSAPGATAADGTVVPGGLVVEGDPALGEYLSGECVTCHQLSGKFDGIPSIVGWPASWLVRAMEEYKERKRANPVMQTIAGRYSAEEIAALAVYFERLPKHPPR